MKSGVSGKANDVAMEALPTASPTIELTDPLSGSICFELRKTSVTVMTAMSAEFAQWHLKPSEANLLRYIGANPGCTQNELARALPASATNLVPLIARLQREGLVERSSGGGRAIALSVSSKGRNVLDGVNEGFDRLEDLLGERLTKKERLKFIDALRIVRKAACPKEGS